MRTIRILCSTLVCLFLVGLVSTVAAQVNPKNLKKHIQFLASDKMKGRETGRPGSHKAADYVEKHFKKYGLIPKGEQGYRQTFEAKIRRVKLADSIRQSDNIIGFLDNKSQYTIVVGAHYDHLGYAEIGGSRDSLGVGKLHNGADDNASGVAGLLELARHYATNKEKETFNILFIGFGAEELGLVGSRYFTEHPTIPLSAIHWMLNMDMIGRYQEQNGLAVIGYGTSSAFPKIFQGLKSTIKFNLSRDGNGGSDQTSFYRKNIPVLFFHTGGHEDYHKSTDDEPKIDYKALEAILRLEIEVIDQSMKQDKMDFQWTN
ncbi:M20/M25/M40 family metallo-hydrolase [Sphingobacterium sp. DK4209]|uniref:M20/M25/M40 family metallo-hydrolase n=1 Tax=Sphingobacterium zhuxiongii TaxID=2662364 RepID=A0A5Q0Q5L1_9SPHI|nr:MULTISPECIES: M20/M25/M40 family metallo-hydrolase [unclassified Sphingobacterium]MVZ65017.1 M20/M25/M40 family metallo-hydrolase [Sphingobacterium sp. DK4209]QGA25355.1 M20/M25/M40 family metallo-hydrolase [Sphingobacterium sp. dk4302]